MFNQNTKFLIIGLLLFIFVFFLMKSKLIINGTSIKKLLNFKQNTINEGLKKSLFLVFSLAVTFSMFANIGFNQYVGLNNLCSTNTPGTANGLSFFDIWKPSNVYRYLNSGNNIQEDTTKTIRTYCEDHWQTKEYTIKSVELLEEYKYYIRDLYPVYELFYDGSYYKIAVNHYQFKDDDGNDLPDPIKTTTYSSSISRVKITLQNSEGKEFVIDGINNLITAGQKSGKTYFVYYFKDIEDTFFMIERLEDNASFRIYPMGSTETGKILAAQMWYEIKYDILFDNLKGENGWDNGHTLSDSGKTHFSYNEFHGTGSTIWVTDRKLSFFIESSKMSIDFHAYTEIFVKMTLDSSHTNDNGLMPFIFGDEAGYEHELQLPRPSEEKWVCVIEVDMFYATYYKFIDIMEIVFPITISVILVFGLYFGVMFGVRYARAVEDDEKKKLKSKLTRVIVACIIFMAFFAVTYVIIKSGALKSIFI